MFTGVVFMTDKRWKQLKYPSAGEWHTVYSNNGTVFANRRGMKHWHTLQHGLTSQTLCYVNEVRFKRPYIVWSRLHEMSRKANLQRRQIHGCLELGVEEMTDTNRFEGIFVGVMKMLENSLVGMVVKICVFTKNNWIYE